jgi:hypothetical protein
MFTSAAFFTGFISTANAKVPNISRIKEAKIKILYRPLDSLLHINEIQPPKYLIK